MESDDVDFLRVEFKTQQEQRANCNNATCDKINLLIFLFSVRKVTTNIRVFLNQKISYATSCSLKKHFLSC